MLSEGLSYLVWFICCLRHSDDVSVISTCITAHGLTGGPKKKVHIPSVSHAERLVGFLLITNSVLQHVKRESLVCA